LQAFPNRFEAFETIMPIKNVKKNMENEIVLAHLTKADLALQLYHAD
jgi:hypothetical protein